MTTGRFVGGTGRLGSAFRTLLLAGLLASAVETAGAADSLESTAGYAAYEAGRPAEAFELWRPAAEAGDPIAQYGLGLLLEQGADGVPRDPRQAAIWYTRAAEQGLAAAQTNLGLMYAQARGVSRDPERAVDYWQRAAHNGHPMAQYNLGFAYYRGLGVEESPGQAALWFERAAMSGLAEAQYAFAQMLRLGLAVEPDSAAALAWYRAAADQGHPQAEQQARSLEANGVQPAPISWNQAVASAPPVSLPPREPTPASPQAESSEPLQSEEPPAESVEPPQTEGTPPASPESASEAALATLPDLSEELAREEEEAALNEPDGQPGHYIWIGSLPSEAAARQHWRDVAAAHGDALDGLAPRYQPVESPDRARFIRVLGGPFDDAEEANRRCQAMAAAFCRVMLLDR